MVNILSDNEHKYLHDVKFNKAVDSMRAMMRVGMSIEEIDQAKNYAIEIESRSKQIKYGSGPVLTSEWKVPD